MNGVFYYLTQFLVSTNHRQNIRILQDYSLLIGPIFFSQSTTSTNQLTDIDLHQSLPYSQL